MGAVNATVMGLAAQCCAAGALDQGQSQRLELLRKGERRLPRRKNARIDAMIALR